LKTKVYDASMGMDGLLLERLMNNETLKSHFFEEVNGTLVFDKMKFAWVLESREFLPDSYTMFKNKIGLADSKGRLISKQRDIMLVWPYKDCVLEGGQTKEDQKRNEIFYNETLAPDEVSRLLYPKVFTNARRYSKNGIEEITKIEDEDNLIIKGNNLLALASLLKRYEGKVKCIYIDPPFNTGSDSFRYNDAFNHSSWLTFMKNRLMIAQELLSDDGVIFVHADHNEIHYLKILMDEIFGRENFLNDIIWCYRERETSKRFFNRKHDNILFYVKNPEGNYLFNYDLIREEYSKVTISKFKYTDENGRKYRLRTKDGDSDPAEESDNTYRQYLDEESGPLPRDWFILPFLNQAASERVGFNTQKPEKLIHKFILATTKENDIVLDFFGGSGTTASVAHKTNRQYISVEQMEEQLKIQIKRLKNVIQGDQTGISQEVNWQGGGSFVYCELMEQNESIATALQAANTTEDIQAILNRITDDGLIIPSVLPDDLCSHMDEFAKMPLGQQKKLVMELIDKNKLYVNLCDMDDKELAVSDVDKAFTRSFYRMDEKGGI
ncbi:MAG TPA: site-specific DNA-methyltransferase, partial [Thermoanaerobacterales bacterium]|nr:site-specific DNA-methyltransferase [Thermoanaerobacterales bacterium]